jgi:YD repeat-containing protein
MKKTTLILTAFGLLLIFLGCREKMTTTYYRHINLTAMHNIEPKYPMKPDTTTDDYCFKIVRDGKGRIVSLKFPAVGGQGCDPPFPAITISIARKEGREIWHYRDQRGYPIKITGVYAGGYRYDKNGHPISSANLDSLGNPIEDSLGVCKFLLTSNEKGFETDFLRLNYDGDTITDLSGAYHTHYIYDDNDRLIERSNYDSTGALAAESDSIAITRLKYDSHGNIIERAFFGTDNKPRAVWGGNTAVDQYKYNDIGDVIEVRSYDESCEPIATQNGDYHLTKIDSWPNGNPREIKYFDKTFTLRKDVKLSSSGATMEDKFYGPDGKLEVDKDMGFAALISVQDENGNNIEEALYDEQMRPVISPRFGFAVVKYEYDKYNYVTKCSYFDTGGKLFENTVSQYAFATYKYDYNNYTYTETYRDVRGFPKKCNYGYAVKTSYYDKDWNLTDCKYFDEAGNLVTTSKFDKDGEMIP